MSIISREYFNKISGVEPQHKDILEMLNAAETGSVVSLAKKVKHLSSKNKKNICTAFETAINMLKDPRLFSEDKSPRKIALLEKYFENYLNKTDRTYRKGNPKSKLEVSYRMPLIRVIAKLGIVLAGGYLGLKGLEVSWQENGASVAFPMCGVLRNGSSLEHYPQFPILYSPLAIEEVCLKWIAPLKPESSKEEIEPLQPVNPGLESLQTAERVEHQNSSVIAKEACSPFEELLPARKEILRSGKGDGQVPCREWTESSLDPVLKDRDCAELPVQLSSIALSKPEIPSFIGEVPENLSLFLDHLAKAQDRSDYFYNPRRRGWVPCDSIDYTEKCQGLTKEHNIAVFKYPASYIHEHFIRKFPDSYIQIFLGYPSQGGSIVDTTHDGVYLGHRLNKVNGGYLTIAGSQVFLYWSHASYTNGPYGAGYRPLLVEVLTKIIALDLQKLGLTGKEFKNLFEQHGQLRGWPYQGVGDIVIPLPQNSPIPEEFLQTPSRLYH